VLGPHLFSGNKQVTVFGSCVVDNNCNFPVFGRFGEIFSTDLCPNGSEIEVNNENKKKYVQLMTQHMMTSAIREQIDAFLSGLYAFMWQ
jgi:hypothetical protein